MGGLAAIHLSFIFRFLECLPFHVWPTALKLGCITNFDMHFFGMHFFGIRSSASTSIVQLHYVM